jgi:hypothetical protein
MKRLFLMLFLLSYFASTYAQTFSNAFFSSESVTLHFILLDETKGIVAASTQIYQGSCYGIISGIGKIQGKTLIFTPFVKVEKGNQCSITAEFNSSWNQVKITSNDECVRYHGAACGWEGGIAKRVKGNE